MPYSSDPVVTAEDDEQSEKTYDPPYCYFEGGTNYEKFLRFNADGSNTGPCGAHSGTGDKSSEYYDRCVCSKLPAGIYRYINI